MESSSKDSEIRPDDGAPPIDLGALLDKLSAEEAGAEKSPSAGKVTELLVKWSDGDSAALERMIPLVYDELHRMAERKMRGERMAHTLQPTALVNEVYLRLIKQNRVTWRSRVQFLAISARLMRRVLIDHARRKRQLKRRASTLIPLDEHEVAAPEKAMDVLELEDALVKLGARKPGLSEVVELRIFGGLTIEETAEALEVSTGTVINKYRGARAWLYREMTAGC